MNSLMLAISLGSSWLPNADRMPRVQCEDNPAQQLLRVRGMERNVAFPQRQELPRDRWFAPDKLRHFFLSYGVTAFAWAGADLAGMKRSQRAKAAVITTAITGLAKEISDTRRGQFFSAKDLLWDALGISAGLVILRTTR